MFHQCWALCALLMCLSANAKDATDKGSKNNYASPDQITSTTKDPVSPVSPVYGAATGPVITGSFPSQIISSSPSLVLRTSITNDLFITATKNHWCQLLFPNHIFLSLLSSSILLL